MRVWGSGERALAASIGEATPTGALPIVDVETLVAAATSLRRAPSEERFPLLTHVARRSRELGLTSDAWSGRVSRSLRTRLRDPRYQPYDRAGVPIEVGAAVECYQSFRVVGEGRVSGFAGDRVRVACGDRLVTHKAADLITVA